MPTLIIGSTAMQSHGVGNRSPKDLDVFSDDPRTGDDVFWHESFRPWIEAGCGFESGTASLDELYTIKVSHSQWDLKNNTWWKHVYDIVELKRAGAVLDLELHNLLYKVWEGEHGKKVMDLTKDKSEFFDDAVRRTFDHDSLHESVAYGDRPIYAEVLKDGAEVDMDMKKIRALPLDKFVSLIKEEVFVTALERIVVPRNYKCSPHAAYLWALRRTATSLTKGWTSRTIMDNIQMFLGPAEDYVARHLDRSDKLVRL
jgi:hypothetical protein